MRDMMANLDVSSSYREMLKSLDATLGAEPEPALAQQYVDALADLEEPPGTVTGLEEAVARPEEVAPPTGQISDATRYAVAVYRGPLGVRTLCAAFYPHHPEASALILDASTPATWAWAIGSAVFHRLGDGDGDD